MGQIESLLQRPLHYNNIDGLGELGLGLFGLFCGWLDWLQVHNPANSIWKGWRGIAWFWLIIAVIYYGTKAIKKRITYPRTGFVEYRRPKSVWLYALLLGCITALLATGGLTLAARSHWNIDFSHLGLTTPVALLGLMYAAAYAYKFAGGVRWKWGVASAMAMGSVVIAIVPAGIVGAVAGSMSPMPTLNERSFGAWMLTIALYGAISLISGVISFLLYLRHTQPPAQVAE